MKVFKIVNVLFKSMFKKPATLMYPEVPREWQERTRGSIAINEETCILCGICARRCPADAIDVDRNGGTWTIHRMQCIQCGECVAACPKKCLSMDNQYTEPQTEKVVDTYEIQLEKEVSSAADSTGELHCNQENCVYCGLCVKACPADALKVDRKEKIWEVDKEACVKCEACVEKCPKKCLSMGEAEKKTSPKKDKKDKSKKNKKDKEDKKDKKDKEAPAAKSIPEVDEEKCIYCNACANECPSEAISAEMDDWKVDKEKCIGCAACIDVCPAEALKMKTL